MGASEGREEGNVEWPLAAVLIAVIFAAMVIVTTDLSSRGGRTPM